MWLDRVPVATHSASVNHQATTIEVIGGRGARSVAFTPDSKTLLHPDGKTLVTVGEDATLRIWDAKNGKELATLFGVKPDANKADGE
jgi:WD40 repeat protein